MNRGYAAYLKESKKAVKQTLKQRKNYFKFYAWLLLGLLGKLTLFLSPVVDMAGIKLSKDVLNNQQIKVFDSYNGTTKGKSYWALLVSQILGLFLLAAGAAIIYIFLTLVNTVIEAIAIAFTTLDIVVLVTLALSIILYVAIGVFAFIHLLKLTPSSYIAYTDEDACASKVLSSSYNSTKQGKGAIFLNAVRLLWFVLLNYVFFSLIIFVYEWAVITFIAPGATMLGLYAEPIILIDAILSESGIVLPVLELTGDTFVLVYKLLFCLEYVLLVVFIFVMLKKLCKHTLINMVSNYALFEDIVDDKYNTNKVATGVYVSKNKSVRVKKLKVLDVFRTQEDVAFDNNVQTLQPRLLKDLSDVIDFDNLTKDTDVPSEVNK